MANPYNGILFGYNRKKVLIHAVTWMKVENIMLKHYALKKKARKDHIVYYFIYMKCLEWVDVKRRKLDQLLPKAREGV